MTINSPIFGDLSPVLARLGAARGLPNVCYVDEAAFSAEKTRIFFAHWAGVGFAQDVPNPGDVKPIDFLGQPLLLARDRENQLRVFQNTCRHRGMILIDKPQNIKGPIRCPYHSWSYGLDGSLRATPHVGGPGKNEHPGIKREELGLFAIRAHVWHDIVFVNIDGRAPEFAVQHRDLIERWGEFELPHFLGGPESRYTLDVRCNWKLAVENYCESYHLPFVHPGLNSYSRLEDHYPIVEYGKYSGQGTRVYNPSLGADGIGFAEFPGLSEKWNHAAEYISLFPNVLLGVHRDHFYAMLLEPLGQERTREHVGLYYATPEMTEPRLADLRKRNAELWRGVFAEDVFVVEGMQKGRHGAQFDGGHFSPAMEEPTHVFHHWVASQLMG